MPGAGKKKRGAAARTTAVSKRYKTAKISYETPDADDDVDTGKLGLTCITIDYSYYYCYAEILLSS